MKRRVVLFGLVILPALALLESSAPAADEPKLSVLRSKYYRVHTDIDRDLAEDLARRMDAMNDEYQRRLAGFQTDRSAPAMEVYLFRRQEDYLRFTGDRWRNSGGVFMSGRNLLAAFLEGQGRDALRRTLQHEAFHQFAHLAISRDIPIWLNEGIAQLFEEGIWTGDGFILGQVPPRRLRQLKADIENRRLVPFADLMAITPEKWAQALGAEDHGPGAIQYNQSWAMVHFLVQAKDAGGREKYRTRLIQMLESLHQGKPAREAFESAFSANVAGFQARFAEYARALETTPEASMIERQEVLADFLIELKSQGRTFDRMADLREIATRSNFSLVYSDRGMTWSTDPNVSVYFSDIHGRALDDADLFFERRGGPMPDVVCRASDRLRLRTRFHASNNSKKKLEREVLIESPK